MTRLNVVVEGQTEETFIREILSPHLWRYGIHCNARIVELKRRKDGRKRVGGLSTYGKLKSDIARWMREDNNPETYFSTMIDLYAIPDDFPGYEAASGIDSGIEQARTMEKAFREDIDHPRGQFIPYIQVYEFETLLFTDLMTNYTAFPAAFPGNEKCLSMLGESIEDFETPEEINHDNPPSQRLASKLPDYDKIVDGPHLVERIGLKEIREKCSHFARWMQRLENVSES